MCPLRFPFGQVLQGAKPLGFCANCPCRLLHVVPPARRHRSALGRRIDVRMSGLGKGPVVTGCFSGPLDYFATVSAQRIDGYRDHSDGDAIRGNLNIGYRISSNVETRFYLTGASTNQRIPGEVSKDTALNSPRSANPEWVRQDQQRNVDSIDRKSTRLNSSP